MKRLARLVGGVFFAVGSLGSWGCSHKLDGPTPTVTGVAPPAVCQAQNTTAVEITGDGLSPLLTGALDKSQLELPKVSLVQVKNIDGVMAIMSMAVAIPDDPLSPAMSHVRWSSEQKMSFDVYPGLMLATGLYDVDLRNANGNAVNFQGSLLAVPPPALAKISPDVLCGDKTNVVELTGDFFIQSPAAMPTVRMGDKAFSPASMTDCRDLPGTAGFKACKKLTVNLAAKDLAVAVHKIVVENPAPVGCASVEAINLTIVPEPTLAKVEADLVCTAEADNILTATGTGFITVDGVAPKLALRVGENAPLLLPAAATNCTPVAGPLETVQSCTTLTATLGKAALPPGLYSATVENPVPVDCATKQTINFLVVPEPAVTAVQEEIGCTAEGEVLVSLKGSGFLTVGDLKPVVTMGTLTLAPSPAGCTALVGPTEIAQTCTELIVTVPKNTPPGALAITVKNPLPAPCSSKQTISYTVVPPPMVTTVEPDTVCAADGDVAVVVKGTGFLTVAGKLPTVSVGALTLTPTAAGCTDVTGPTGKVTTCTSLQVSLPKSTPAGSFPVSVKNPAPAACKSAPPVGFAVFDRPLITDVVPGASCGQSSMVSLAIKGMGFVTAGAAVPTVKIGSQFFTPTAGGCIAVPGAAQATQLCNQLTVSIPANTLANGQHAILVTNPAPVGCATIGADVFDVASPPVISNVAPATVCAGAAKITLTGTSFSVNATVTLNGTPADQVTVTGGTTALAVFPPTLATGGPFSITISNAGSCSDTKAGAVTVVAGPQAFFVDPEVVYNGITVQATLYGTGFTGAVQKVGIRPSGGGALIALTFTTDAARPGVVQVVIPKDTAPGEYDVELNDATACPAILTKGLTITDQKTLTLAAQAITPAFGWAQGVTAAAISGTGFKQVPRVYLNPTVAGPTTKAVALGAVTFINSSELSVLISGLSDVGKYDLIVVNPDGKVGVAQAAFEITKDPPPTIDSVSPGSVTNKVGAAFAIAGKDFRMPAVSLRCLDSAGALLAATTPATVVSSTATAINATFDAAAAATSGAVACIVRVTDADNQTFADFSALVITNPALNLYGAKTGTDLNFARRAPVALGGNPSAAARYLHVIGGDDNAGAAFDTVESAALSLVGDPGTFFIQRNKLKQARTLAGGVNIGRWLYVAGGASGATPLASVERAAVLDPNKDRGQVADLLLDPSDSKGLAPGVWYYRVASVLKATDDFNPDGENLPSDPFPVRLPTVGTKKFVITLSWTADARAAKYRVYRSKDPGSTVGTEQLLAEVAAPATSFKDEGIAPIATDTPLPVGSTGVWQTLTAALATARQGAGVSWAADPADATKVYLYVVGGKDAAAAKASYEFLAITLGVAGVQTPAGAFVAGTNDLATARWQLAAARATNDLSPRVLPGTTFIYALSGVATNGTTLVTNANAASVTAGGQLGAWSTLDNLSQAGYVSLVAGTSVFAFGGLNAATSNAIRSGEICAAGVGGCAANVAPIIKNWNAGQTMLASRYLMGGTLSGAFIYITGGVSDGGAATKSTEYRLW